MIISRLALFVALLFGVAATQVPEYVQQYRQRLGGAIDELSAIVAQFDAETAGLGITEDAGVARLEANADPLAQARGRDMAALISRLARLRRLEASLDSTNAVVRWTTFVASFDPPIAARAYADYQPAVPTTFGGLIAGLAGFVIGGGLVHLLGLPIRHRHKLFRPRAGAAGGLARLGAARSGAGGRPRRE